MSTRPSAVARLTSTASAFAGTGLLLLAAVRRARGATVARAAVEHLVHGEQLDLEDQRGLAGDLGRLALVAVGEARGDGELALAADLHPHRALVPALDDA